MDDREWIERLRSTPPHQLEAGELRRVKRKIAESPEFCEALAADPSLQRLVDAAFAVRDETHVESPPESAPARSRWRTDSQWFWLGASAVFALVVLGLGSLLVQSWSVAGRAPQTAAQVRRLNSEHAQLVEQPAKLPAHSPSPPTTGETGDKRDGDSAAKETVDAGGPRATAEGASPAGAEAPEARPPKADSPPPPSSSKAPPATVPTVERPPWHDVVTSAAEPGFFADSCFDGFDFTKSLPSKEHLQRWFATVVGHGLRWTDTRTEFGTCGTFEGLVRFQAPLGNDIALRLAIDNYPRLQFHLWAGREGVSLVHYAEENNRWLAYTTTRRSDEAVPQTWSLVASDAGRTRRSAARPNVPFELRHRDGEVVLSRGDIVLVSAPLAEHPTEIFLGGRATFLGIAMVRTKDGPTATRSWPEYSPEAEAAAARLRPAELNWEGSLGDARLEKRDDGSIRLASSGTNRVATTATIPGGGVREILVEVADATPGAGIFLARGGQGLGRFLRVIQDKRYDGLQLVWAADDDKRDDLPPPIPDRPSAATRSSMWLRFVTGCGLVRTWKSDDGHAWVELQPPLKVATSGLTHLGLQLVAGAKDGGLTVRQVVTRPLPRIEQLADKSLLDRAPDLAGAKDLAGWSAQVAQSKPPEVDESAWQAACAIKTLGAGGDAAWGPLLVERLLDIAAARDLPLEQQIALVTEAGTLVDVYETAAVVQQVARRLQRLGMAAFESHELRPYSSVRPAVMTTPLESRQTHPLFDPAAIRCELLQLLYAGQWRDVVWLVRTVRFFQQHEQTVLLPWADNYARRMTPGRDAPTVPGDSRRGRGRSRLGRPFAFAGPRSITPRPSNQWTHPFQEELSKDAYNAFAEIEALLASEAYDDAARMIAALTPDAVAGLAPLTADEELLVSLPAAVPWFIAECPPLAEAMERRFSQIAPLRVRQAIQSGEPAAVQLAARQFFGTEAAAEAEQWLGDRALATGYFAAARAAYERAERTASIEVKPTLEARRRLAAALLGEDAGSAPGSSVSLGEISLSSAEFDTLIAQLRARSISHGTSDPPEQRQRVVAPAVRPGPVEPQTRAAVDGLIGEQPNEEVTRNLTKLKVDWAGRQLGWTIDGDLLVVNNRFHLAAYDLKSGGQRRWQTALPDGKRMLRSRDWALVAMSPRVAGSQVFARLLLQEGPILGCWGKSDGKLLWLADGLKNMPIASDPWLIQDRLQALTIARLDNQDSMLRLATFDPQTGELVSQADLARLNVVWQVRHVCETALVDDMLVTVLGGAVLACDLNGQVRWIRKLVVLPPDEEPEWVTQVIQKPLVREGRLFVTQPGVRSVDCLDVATGALLWRRFLPEVRQALALDGDRLIVVTDAGLEALSTQEGKTIWRHAAADLLTARLAGGPHGIVYTRATPVDNGKKQRPQLVWLDAATGKLQSTVDLPQLDDPDPRLGPFLTHDSKWWAFFGRGPQEPKRELIELIHR